MRLGHVVAVRMALGSLPLRNDPQASGLQHGPLILSKPARTDWAQGRTEDRVTSAVIVLYHDSGVNEHPHHCLPQQLSRCSAVLLPASPAFY